MNTITLHKAAPWATPRQRKHDHMLRYHRAEPNGGATARYAQVGNRYFKVMRTSWNAGWFVTEIDKAGEDIWVGDPLKGGDLKFLVSVGNLDQARKAIEQETATRPTYRTVVSSELAQGMVVNCHGMRCLIDGEIHSRGADRNRVFWTRALVLNRSEIPSHVVPFSFTPDDRWTIQGNDLARWSVEVLNAS